MPGVGEIVGGSMRMDSAVGDCCWTLYLSKVQSGLFNCLLLFK